jgi:hypothetical protein
MPRPKQSRGAQFREDVLADYDLGTSERLLLDEAAAVIDEIDALPAGQIVERRQQRMLLSRLIGQLAEPDAKGDSGPVDGKVLRGRRAAEARWKRVQNEA